MRQASGRKAERPHLPAIAVVGDLHTNSVYGLFPPSFTLDAGNVISANKYQAWLWDCWLDFSEYIKRYDVCHVIVNGDLPQGINFKDAQLMSVNEADQIKLAATVLDPLLYRAGLPKPKLFIARGTGFHDGRSGALAEVIAQKVGAIPDEGGCYSRWQIWLNWRGHLVHATHHIGVAPVYPYTPLARELTNWKIRSVSGGLLPDVDLRAHVHRCNAIQDNSGRWIATSPAWQLQTQYTHQKAPAMLPEIGGLIVWENDDGELYIKRKLYPLPAPTVQTV